jgi:3-dehydroquinate synthase
MEKIELTGYSLFLGTGVWDALTNTLEDLSPSQIVVLCDAHTRIYCLPELVDRLSLAEPQVITVPAGETYKNLDTCRIIWRNLMDRQLDRKALLLNLGGGVIGDMGGFCAATFKRGIRFIQIPTTLLSMVDASIGGKLGIDFAQIKNSIGLFQNPEGVFIHTGFLQSLPPRELRSGFAEMIKHALIGNAGQWSRLRRMESLSDLMLEDQLRPSLEIKKRIVEADPREQGERKLLNFGHTIGHAVESYFLNQDDPLLHGEAIAVGMICEAYLSHLFCDFPLEELSDLSTLIHRIYGTREIPTESFQALLPLMHNDKKNEGGQIRFTLLKQPGEGIWDYVCPEDTILESLAFYNKQS